jgi:hypothetical protein
MSIQPGRPMLAVLRETLRKLECPEIRESPDQEQLKRILRRRIAEMQSVLEQPSKYFGR